MMKASNILGNSTILASRKRMSEENDYLVALEARKEAIRHKSSIPLIWGKHIETCLKMEKRKSGINYCNWIY